MKSNPVFTRKENHRLAEQLPILDLYAGLELVMSQQGCHTLAVFLSPQQALALAENLIREARAELARRESAK